MKNIIYNSQYQNLHMDRANKEAMKTVKVTINTNLAYSSTPRRLYRYKHGYDYPPQFWGLWDINYFPNGPTNYRFNRRAYGFILHNTAGTMLCTFYYTVDSEYVNLYLLFNGTVTKPNISGTNLTFTGYVFANDRSPQDYT